MGHVVKTPAGTYRANWRDATGKQKAKTFRTKREASTFLAATETAVNTGAYVDPHAGRVRFRDYAERWTGSRVLGARSAERTVSIMRTHVLPKWGAWPLDKIRHDRVQEWVGELSDRLAPDTVAKCVGALSMVMRSAVRSRLLGVDPTDGITVPRTHARRAEVTTISPVDFVGRLLPAVPPEHRALVSAAAGAGLRWGECAGLAWGSVDLREEIVRVVQVAEETSGAVVVRTYPKTRAGVRTVPMVAFLVAALRAHLGRLPSEPHPRSLVFPTSNGTPFRRSNFRRQVWRPALVRAGLLGQVVEVGQDDWRAIWSDAEGIEWRKEFTTERDAVAHVAAHATGGLRFHDLRHSYASALVSAGIPVNVAQRVMGHESAATTLGIYTHAPSDYRDRITRAFEDPADDLLTEEGDEE